MGLLPAGFEPLEPFLDYWAVAGEAARAEARSHASDEDRGRFYNACLPLMQEALSYLDGKQIESLDEPDARLMRLMLSLANVFHSVEVLGDAEPENARMRARLQFTDRAPY